MTTHLPSHHLFLHFLQISICQTRYSRKNVVGKPANHSPVVSNTRPQHRAKPPPKKRDLKSLSKGLDVQCMYPTSGDKSHHLRYKVGYL